MQQQQQHQVSFHQPYNSISGQGEPFHPSTHENPPLTMVGITDYNQSIMDYNQSLALVDFGEGWKGKGSACDKVVHPSIYENPPLTMSGVRDYNQGLALADFSEDGGKSSKNDEASPDLTEDPSDVYLESNKGKHVMPWSRVRWNDKMVRLMLTALSYAGEDAELEKGLPWKNSNLQRRCKWKLVSNVMAERGHYVSPQQCEDKFYDLNRKYKRLNEILRRGTSCQVVERPELLDVLDHVSEKEKAEVKRILNSKQLFYEEMCSYLNGNRLHLPHDPELQLSMMLALGSRHGRENKEGKQHSWDNTKDGHDAQRRDLEDNFSWFEDQRALYCGVHFAKRSKPCQGEGGVHLENYPYPLNCNRASNSSPPKAQGVDLDQLLLQDEKQNQLQKQQVQERRVQLERQKLQLQAKTIALEKKRLQWQSFCKKEDQKLEAFRRENEKMKLENMHMALGLKRQRMDARFKSA